MARLTDLQTAFCASLDVGYSYRLARRLEQFKSNAALGYRTAGSDAEFKTGEMLAEEMRAIGLCDVKKDPFRVDAWEFSHARLSFPEADGKIRRCELGGYQTDFAADEKFRLLYAGRGTAAELSGLDVRGKLVLVDINQRDEWWISYPVYQAHLHGAAAVLAVQDNGYGQVDCAALNAQNIAGPADAPAFSISREDAGALRRKIAADGGETTVWFDAKSSVTKDSLSYNITGCIPGENGIDEGELLLVSAHYDSYFSGFQDDNAAVAMMMGIAKTLVEIRYRPKRTILFCAMAAEEWGVSDSKFDWSAGAYSQIFRVRPEWAGRAVADINFELPAYPHDTRDVVRCVYEYRGWVGRFLQAIPDVTHLYPDGVAVASPVLTWSDDFSMSIAGVPAMVNDFAGGSFMESHYHSQFDTDEAYDEGIYRFHHELYGSMIPALDFCALPPLNFVPRFRALRERLDVDCCARAGVDTGGLVRAVDELITCAELCWQRVEDYNLACDKNAAAEYAAAGGVPENTPAPDARRETLARQLLEIFRICEDNFVRLTWHDEVIFPHEYAQHNLNCLEGAADALKNGRLDEALDCWLPQIDANRYAAYFDEATCRHFIDYVLCQPAERLMWGAGRIVGNCDLSGTVRSLIGKRRDGTPAGEELGALTGARERQAKILGETVEQETRAAVEIAELLRRLTAQIEL